MKTILLTGAYGGMGRETARLLASRGCCVFALDCVVGDPEENIIPVQADLTDSESVRAAYAYVRAHTDHLDAIVHFAGVYMLDSLIEMREEDFRRIFDINVQGVFLVNRHFFPLLSEGSRILITTSELAPLDPLPFTGVYGVSKSALDKYAFALAMELQLRGIHVSVLRAGAVETKMLGASTAALDRFTGRTALYSCNAARFRAIVGRVEARCIPPARVARLACKILEKRRPAFAYSINRNPLLLLLNCLPKRCQLFAIRQILRRP